VSVGRGLSFWHAANLQCVFCKTSRSASGRWRGLPPARMAAMMLELQRTWLPQYQLRDATHQVFQILRALPIAIEGGLRLPLVYNCGGTSR